MSPAEINDIANWIVIMAALPFLLFSLTYGLRDPWFKSYLGVIMLGLITSQWVVLVYIAVRRWLGNFAGYEWVSIGLYSSLTLFAWLFYGIYLVERRRSPMLEIPLTKSLTEGKGVNKMTNSTTPVAQPIWYKAQRVLRTAVQTLLSALAVWAALQLVIPDVMAELAKILPESWILWLAGVIAAVTAIASALSRIFAIPAVNNWLTKWLNLGSVPKSKLIDARTVEDGKVVTITMVQPDPKAVLPGDTRDTYRDRNDG